VRRAILLALLALACDSASYEIDRFAVPVDMDGGVPVVRLAVDAGASQPAVLFGNQKLRVMGVELGGDEALPIDARNQLEMARYLLLVFHFLLHQARELWQVGQDRLPNRSSLRFHFPQPLTHQHLHWLEAHPAEQALRRLIVRVQRNLQLRDIHCLEPTGAVRHQRVGNALAPDAWCDPKRIDQAKGQRLQDCIWPGVWRDQPLPRPSLEALLPAAVAPLHGANDAVPHRVAVTLCHQDQGVSAS
jgi:hypothetical protein